MIYKDFFFPNKKYEIVGKKYTHTRAWYGHWEEMEQHVVTVGNGTVSWQDWG